MEDFYITLEKAKVEIQKRWFDEELKKEILKYLDGDVPQPFLQGPRAVMFRNIASPDLEFLYFVNYATQNDLSPIILEYTHDVFSSKNDDKLSLVKLAIFEKRNKNGDGIFHYKKIVNINRYDGHSFCNIKTTNGENLVDYHHNLLNSVMPEFNNYYDMSDWLAKHGSLAKKYYEKIFALYLVHGILFENFVTNESEAGFEDDVVMPAFKKIKSLFGLQPLIVSLARDPNDVYWWSYSSNIEKYINK